MSHDAIYGTRSNRNVAAKPPIETGIKRNGTSPKGVEPIDQQWSNICRLSSSTMVALKYGY